ncbi:MAG: hypothetical protein WBZ42_09035 [Halobacteriota archaeon]
MKSKKLFYSPGGAQVKKRFCHIASAEQIKLVLNLESGLVFVRFGRKIESQVEELL